MIFNKNKINVNTDVFGKELSSARQTKGIEIKKAAEELKIKVAYLEALEAGRFEKLPRGIYGRNFLREYALFLGLDAKKLCQIYDKETEPAQKQDKLNLFSRTIPDFRCFFAFPKIIKNALIFLSIVICTGYFIFSFNKIISPPFLLILSPDDNFITKENFIDIKGQTDPEAEVIINGEIILKKDNGFFEKRVNLKNGVNTISISAQRKYSQKNIVIKRVLVKS